MNDFQISNARTEIPSAFHGSATHADAAREVHIVFGVAFTPLW